MKDTVINSDPRSTICKSSQSFYRLNPAHEPPIRNDIPDSSALQSSQTAAAVLSDFAAD